jgi:3-hydroxyisobutyrate dehydrogenase-like beta-hydroxyacid dehydrogenase
MPDRITPRRIALIAPGAMGSAVGALLVAAGHEVMTSLTGRSAASQARAKTAGMIDAPDAQLAGCDMILSIVPPAEAAGLVERFVPLLAGRGETPLFVDANALNPDSKAALAQRLGDAGCAMVDAAIIGPPPAGATRPTFMLLSGPRASEAMLLDLPGCAAEVIGERIGAASALKMCYGGINKGVVGLASAMLLAAERHGAAEALRREMQRSMPDLFARFGRQVPDMVPKAYRWVAEMEEIAAFLGADDAAGARLFEGLAGEFARIAADRAGEGRLIATLGRAVSAD